MEHKEELKSLLDRPHLRFSLLDQKKPSGVREEGSATKDSYNFKIRRQKSFF